MRFFSFTACVFLLSATPVLAQINYVPLVGIPGLTGQNLNTANYVNQLYILAIVIAAIAAFLRLTFSGVKYMLTDVVPAKQAAKTDIKNSLLGLLIVVSAVLILYTINPQLTNLNALGNLQSVRNNSGTFNVVTSGNGGGSGSTENNPNPTRCGEGQRLVRDTTGQRCQTNTPLTPPPGFENSSAYLTALAEDTRDTRFRIDEPALPSAGLAEGELHNEPIRVVSDQTEACSARVDVNLPGNLGQPSAQPCVMVVVELTSTNQRRLIGCGLITPEPRVCQLQ